MYVVRVSSWFILLAVGRALLLAQEIAKFPQECLNADRASAYYAAFNAKSMEDALHNELESGMKVIGSESIEGEFDII